MPRSEGPYGSNGKQYEQLNETWAYILVTCTHIGAWITNVMLGLVEVLYTTIIMQGA